MAEAVLADPEAGELNENGLNPSGLAGAELVATPCPNPDPAPPPEVVLNEKGDDVDVGVVDAGPNENGLAAEGFTCSAAFGPKPKGLALVVPNELNVDTVGFSGALVCCVAFPKGLLFDGVLKLNVEEAPEVPNGDEAVRVEELLKGKPAVDFKES